MNINITNEQAYEVLLRTECDHASGQVSATTARTILNALQKNIETCSMCRIAAEDIHDAITPEISQAVYENILDQVEAGEEKDDLYAEGYKPRKTINLDTYINPVLNTVIVGSFILALALGINAVKKAFFTESPVGMTAEPINDVTHIMPKHMVHMR